MRHLHKAEEILAYTLCSMHNIHFLLSLMAEMRTALEQDRFPELARLYGHNFGAGQGAGAVE